MYFNQSKAKIFFLVFEKVIYLIMVILGFYFVYEGEVFGRFYRGRTNFAVYEEEISEHPVIVTLMENSYNYKPLILGKDFKVMYRRGIHGSVSSAVNLTFGENAIEKVVVSVRKQRYNPAFYEFHVTSTNSSTNIPLDYGFIYVLENATVSMQLNVMIRTANGTVPCNGKFNDGKTYGRVLPLGQFATFTITPEKKIHLPDAKRCRLKPYTTEFNEKFIGIIQQQCKIPCRHSLYLNLCPGLSSNEDMENICPFAITQKKANVSMKLLHQL